MTPITITTKSKNVSLAWRAARSREDEQDPIPSLRGMSVSTPGMPGGIRYEYTNAKKALGGCSIMFALVVDGQLAHYEDGTAMDFNEVRFMRPGDSVTAYID